MLKLPPYGKTLQTAQDLDLPLEDVYIFMGKDGWNRAKKFQAFRPTTTCLPLYASPNDFCWPVIGCEIMLFDTSVSTPILIDNFIRCLFSFGARGVWFITVDFKLQIYKKDF